MVKVREVHAIDVVTPAEAARLLEQLPGVTDAGQRVHLRAALDWALAATAGEPPPAWLAPALDIGATLAALGLDESALLAGVLCLPFLRGQLTPAAVRERFGAGVEQLLAGVQRMDALSLDMPADERRHSFANPQRQGETIRRMLVAMIDDPRVPLVKLAERVQVLRALRRGDDDPRTRRIAREALEIFAPLAHRLGVAQVKWELEDLAFRALEPVAYKEIAAALDETRVEREHFIAAVKASLRAALAAAGIAAQVSGRPKHLYSIWRKMQRKGVDVDRVYDVRAVRVMVDGITDCYATLGVVHQLWRNLPQEFDDYVAHPKPNGYRSLHTAVVGDGGKIVEVQIRTAAMHAEAELGICAHWQYKSGGERQPGAYEDKLEWLRQVLGWSEDLDAGEVLADHLRHEASADRVYVFTPDGHVIDLPQGATPVDFAYQVHSELGHRCRGAKIDGRIVTLDHVLRTGEHVEILRGKQAAPNRDWLLAGNRFVTTARARARIRHWFREQNRDQLLAAGRALYDREAQRPGVSAPSLPQVARTLGFTTADDLLLALASGELGLSRLATVLQPAALAPVPAPTGTAPAVRRSTAGAVAIAGMDNVLTQFPACCKPVPGDAVRGYITAGRGVSVHRAECPKLQSLAAAHPGRTVDVQWQAEQPHAHAVSLKIVAQDRSGLIKDLATLLANERVHILRMDSTLDHARQVATVRLSVEVRSLAALARVLDKIARVRAVISAVRHID